MARNGWSLHQIPLTLLGSRKKMPVMKNTQLDKNTISDVDHLLQKLNQQQSSASQQKEINKHKPIFEQRDNPNVEPDKNELWKGF